MLAAPPLLVQVPIVRAGILGLADAMRHGGVEGVGLYTLVYLVGSVLTAPIALLSGLAGFAWGRAWGFAAALPLVTLGSTAAFLLGHRLGQTRWAASLRAHPRLRLIDAVVRADGLRIATLLRLSPLMPQNLLSYALGTTALRTGQFALATCVGLVPATLVHVWLGSAVRDATELLEGRAGPRGPMAWVFPALGLAVTVVFMAFVMRLARRQLGAAMARAEAEAPSDGA
jgi:uncharacterized membrane protein YdjX (TVP38/TMEM64 family)